MHGRPSLGWPRANARGEFLPGMDDVLRNDSCA
jgi:hypothetical protein